jgi:hypothetical protein
MSAEHTTRDDIWEDLIVSILSVNQYSLERTYGALESLRCAGLFDPANLVKWEADEFVRRLKAAGCDRGEFMTSLFAVRLASLGHFLSQTGIEKVAKILRSKNRVLIEETLLPVNGIGPKVIRNYCFLQGSDA